MRPISCIILSIVLVVCLLPASLPASGETRNAFRHRASSEEPETVQADVAEEIRFGREVAARIIGRFSLYHDDRLMKYVNLVGHALSLNANRPEIKFHFAVLNTNEINAYAAPGGYVFVTRGAIEQMRDESELAAVLGHEMTHINERHVVKALDIRGSEGSATSGLARLIGGGTESARIAFYQAVDKALDILFKDGYGREDEIQADRGAVLLCTLSGYDPSGLIRYFERISAVKDAATETLDKTHPPFTDRIAWLRDMITTEGIETASLKTYAQRFFAVQQSMH
jgi:predicted Zn-dependent protease